MPNERAPKYVTGDATVDEAINTLLDSAGITHNRDQVFEILVSGMLLAQDDASRLDLKITNSALREMRTAFRTFSPYRDRPKITMFGSARTTVDNPIYEQAKNLAARLAGQGWMVVTGAGPGVMAAGLQGAGRDNAMGVSIRLPFESTANEYILDDPKLVEMKYFFTRKLSLVKESDGFVVLPGGFGTLDEAFELLTLIQTGKAEPAPIVMLDEPGGSFWQEWHRYIKGAVSTGEFISPGDDALYMITDDVDKAAEEILDFYRNYHSRRWVGSRLVVRLRVEPTDEELDDLTARFADSLVSGRIDRTAPLPTEVQGNDSLNYSRIVMRFDRRHQARLRELINACNALPSAAAQEAKPVHYLTPAD